MKVLDVFEAPLQGISVVEASAGTGKTYSITSLYIRAVLEKELQPSEILVLTFTEAATAELKGRIRDRLKEALQAFKKEREGSYEGGDAYLTELVQQDYQDPVPGLKQAIRSFDEAAVFTIHGFCNRLLREHALQFGVAADFEILRDESELLQECTDTFWRNFIRSANQSLLYDAMYRFLVEDGFTPDDLNNLLLDLLSRPYAELIPDSFNDERLKSTWSDFKSKYREVQYYWKEQKDDLYEILWHDKLHGNIYRKKKRDEYWESLEEWVSRDEVPLSYFEKLELFGTKISESGTGGHVFEKLDVSKAIDQYLALHERLQDLKPAFILESFHKVKELIQQEKEKRSLLSYNDLLTTVNRAITSSKSTQLTSMLSQKYPIALVDEFQDTDPVQYEIFREIYANRSEKALFMIGDPKQAIYGFRGADINTYFEARNESVAEQNYRLGSNYRSSQAMIQGVNEFFQISETPFQVDPEQLQFQQVAYPEGRKEPPRPLLFKREHQKPLKFIKIPGDKGWNKNDFREAAANRSVREILRLLNNEATLDGEAIRPQDIAILVRTTRNGEDLQNRLRTMGIQSVLKGNSSVFDSREADELYLLLKAILHLSYEPGIRAALATQLAGFDASAIQKLLDDPAEWSTLYTRFTDWKEMWEKKGLEFMLSNALHYLQAYEHLARLPAAERKITNLKHLTELLARAEKEQNKQGKELLKWFYRKRQGQLQKYDDEEMRLESDEKLVQITTIHSSKGLEYPIVFCPDLWEDIRLPDPKKVIRFEKDKEVYMDYQVGRKDEKRNHHQYLSAQEAMAEAVRLSYVALTRAESACYVPVADYKHSGLSSLTAIVDGKEKMHQRLQARIESIGEEPAYVLSDVISKLENHEAIEVLPAEDKSVKKYINPEHDEGLDLNIRKFEREDLQQYPRMLSYSGLARHQAMEGEQAKDYDALPEWAQSPVETETEQTWDRFHFPKGAKAGTFLHTLFEEVTFTQPDRLQNIIKEELAEAGFDPNWQTMTEQWVGDALHHPLDESGLRLDLLPENDLIKELEFYFPVSGIRSESIWKIIRSQEPSGVRGEMELSGFLKGFIDLSFRHKGKYYILDYKSNFLGHSLADYHKERLASEMTEASYDIQYHLYTIALHRFLKNRLTDYSYEQHFGGVFYLFLRGIHNENPGSGVFFDRPEESLIQSLDNYLGKGVEV